MSTSEEAQTEQFKEQVRQDWEANAEPWRKWHPQFVSVSRAVTDVIVEAAQVTPGMQVLDLASGTGEPALSLAEKIGPSGHVTATDLVPQMLAVAEDNARQRGLANMTFQQADAEALPFPDDSFDVVTCRFGIMFCPNQGQALRDIHRVLKPGGRTALTAWGPFEQNPWVTTTVGVLMQHVTLPPPPPGTPGPFTCAKAGTLSTAMQAAGFSQVQEEAQTVAWTFPGSVEECREFSSGLARNLVQRYLEALAPDQHDQVIAAVLDAIRPYSDGQQINFPADIIVATGVR